jgi:hypothetical protein
VPSDWSHISASCSTSRWSCCGVQKHAHFFTGFLSFHFISSSFTRSSIRLLPTALHSPHASGCAAPPPSFSNFTRALQHCPQDSNTQLPKTQTSEPDKNTLQFINNTTKKTITMSAIAEAARAAGTAAVTYIRNNPKHTAGMMLTTPIAVVATPLVLGAVGFSAGGVVAGTSIPISISTIPSSIRCLQSFLMLTLYRLRSRWHPSWHGEYCCWKLLRYFAECCCWRGGRSYCQWGCGWGCGGGVGCCCGGSEGG